MKQTRNFTSAKISRKAEKSVLGGHPWIYDTEVRELSDVVENGSLVDVCSEKGAYIGTGIYSHNSKIRIRLLSRNANDTFDEQFFRRRIRWAWEYRRAVMGGDANCCRLIFGEADQFPGLTVDKFENILVTQTLSIGMEHLKRRIFPLLISELADCGVKTDGIYERNDVRIRELEGMEQNTGWYIAPHGNENSPTTLVITENGIQYAVDFANGQKTGFFLDQKYNRQAAARISGGRRVLDCFCHTGSFGLNAAHGGARHVRCVDVSQSAVALARDNARLNSLEGRMEFCCANVFDYLPKLEQSGEKYDFIILDPPAFTKSRRTIENAARGYKQINLSAMRMLPRGGFLATCSCSHFMSAKQFCEVVGQAALDAGVQLRQIEARGQAPDHPVLWNVPETDYLKFYLFQVV